MLGFLLFAASAWATSSACLTIQAAHFLEPATGELLKIPQMNTREGRVAIGRERDGLPCRTLPMGDAYVIPGLIDLHTHVMLSEQDYGLDFGRDLLRDLKLARKARLARGNEYAQSLLRAGFTTLRDLGNSGSWLDAELRQSWGPNPSNGPRLLISGPGITTDAAQFPVATPQAQVRAEYTVLEKETHWVALIQERVSHGAEWVKLYADNDDHPGGLTEDQLRTAVEYAHKSRLKVAAHATRDATALSAIRAGVDSLEHGGILSPTTLRELASRKIVWVPTLVSDRLRNLQVPHGFDPGAEPGIVARAAQAKVRMAFGSDAYIDFTKDHLSRGAVALEALLAFVPAGLSPLDALRTATTEAAALLGRTDLGNLNQGSWADLVVVKEDPRKNFETLRHPLMIMREGQIICYFADRPC